MAGGKRRRGKWAAAMPHGASQSGSCRVRHGSVGLLISCNHGQERTAVRNVHAMLDEALNDDDDNNNAVTAGATTTTSDGEDTKEGGEKKKQKDIGEEIEAELRTLKRRRNAEDAGDGARARFQLAEIETGVRGLCFIRVQCAEGEDAAFAAVLTTATRALRKAAATRRCFSQKVMKIVPVTSTCFASADALRRCTRDSLLRASSSGGGGDADADQCPPLTLVADEDDAEPIRAKDVKDAEDTLTTIKKKEEEDVDSGEKEKGATTTTESHEANGGSKTEDKTPDDGEKTRKRKTGTGPSFGVIYEHRGGSVSRDIVIENTAKLLDANVHAVNLKRPDVSIAVQDLRNCFFVSVLPRYHELKKYNVRSMAEGDE